MTEHEELLGADFFEHDIRHPGVGVSRAISVLKNFDEDIDCTIAPTTVIRGNKLRSYKYQKYYISIKIRISVLVPNSQCLNIIFLGHDFFLETYYNQEASRNNSIQKFEGNKNETRDNMKLNRNDIEVGNESSSPQ